MEPRTLGIKVTPESHRLWAYQEFRDAVHDALGDVPLAAEDVTVAVCETLRQELTLAMNALWRLEDACERVELCDGQRQRMLAEASDGPDVGEVRYG